MSRTATARAQIQRRRGSEATEVDDVLAVEEPLEIRVVHGTSGEEREDPVVVTMRTPGHDPELAAGFLFSEGILRVRSDLNRIEAAPPRASEENGNVLRVVLADGVPFDTSRTVRSFYTTSSCGVCGKTSLDALWARTPPPVSTATPKVKAPILAAMPEALRRAQDVFERTGGLHGAALFTDRAEVVTLREDVGRHNAVDKIVGERFLAGALPLPDSILLVSGRASFEILQKAILAGIPFVAAVGAPSSMAVDVAKEFGMTLVGFLRGASFNIYAGAQRIA
ncbi:MAG TPA: formate dehydrogenase accessory sulfurtransferase FdhD [Thermoplasmata archaeon]|jgi:FdhD protein|nr:formate dehydrogenase accessory sulfurtransferase FdhD [Thermoplasmata archaeon]